MSRCNSARHAQEHHFVGQPAAAAPPAVAEWLDPVIGQWRPLCARCLDVVQRSYARQRGRFANDPIALAAFDSTFQVRELPR